MPTVERILPLSGGKSAMVTLSDGRKCRIYKPTLEKLAVVIGYEASDSLLRIFDAKVTAEKARDYAAKVAMRPVFSVEMRSKLLEKGFSEQIADDTVAWLVRIGAVNDKETLGVYLREASRKGRGRRMIVCDLSRRGIDRDMIDAALKDYIADDAALSLLRKKLKGAADRESLRRAAAYLFSKGFSREEIASLLDQYLVSIQSEN